MAMIPDIYGINLALYSVVDLRKTNFVAMILKICRIILTLSSAVGSRELPLGYSTM